MTKSELVTKLFGKLPTLKEEDITLSVALLLESVRVTLEKGRRVEIRGFGSFEIGRASCRERV